MYNLVEPCLTNLCFGFLPLTQIHPQSSKGEEHPPWFLWIRLKVTKLKINITASVKNSSAQRRYVQSQGSVSITKYFLSWSSPVTALCHLTSMETSLSSSLTEILQEVEQPRPSLKYQAGRRACSMAWT